MMHALALVFVFAANGFAYVDVQRIATMPQLRSFFAAYDRETASLRATQHVPQLTDTRPVAQHQAQVVENGARAANAAIDALRSRASQYQPRLPDANAVRSRIADNYGQQSQAVRDRAGQSADQYRAALDRETAHALANYRASLDARVNDAYGTRAQQLREKEAEAQIKMLRHDAGSDLVLRTKLENLKSPQVDRHALSAKLKVLESREDRALAALQAQDDATLATYRAQVVAAAQRDYAKTASELQRKAQANWELRQRVSQAQQQAPQHLTFPAVGNVAFENRWSQFGAQAGATAAAFTSGADDIARRFATIGDMDTQARGTASNEIIALQRDRAGLNDELAREARAIAKRIAAKRGLTLVEGPRAGAHDVTPEVARELASILGR